MTAYIHVSVMIKGSDYSVFRWLILVVVWIIFSSIVFIFLDIIRKSVISIYIYMNAAVIFRYTPLLVFSVVLLINDSNLSIVCI